jgi:hypothetical protein
MGRSTRAAWLIAPFCALLWGCGGSSEPLEETIEHTYPISRDADISITNFDGTIQVSGSEKPELHLQAIKKAYSLARLKDIVVNVSAEPNSISIETAMPPSKTWTFSDRSGTVDYVVIVPETCKISRLELKNGEILVGGMQSGAVRATLGNGRLVVRNCFGDVHVSTATGALVLMYDWWNPRKFSADARIADGNAFAVIPSDASFHVIAEAPNGKIGNDFTEQEQRNGSTVDKIDLVVGESPQAEIRMNADDGNIKIVEANP